MLFTTVGNKTGYYSSIIFLCVLVFFWMLPIIFMVSLSLQPNELLVVSTANRAFGLLPSPVTIKNYLKLLGIDQTPRWFLNSAIVSVVSTVCVLFLSSAAGYAFAKIEFSGKKFVYAFILAGLMIHVRGFLSLCIHCFLIWDSIIPILV
jgi:multiple sugar transport system permease protein